MQKRWRSGRLEGVPGFTSCKVSPDSVCLLYLIPEVLPDLVFGHSLFLCTHLETPSYTSFSWLFLIPIKRPIPFPWRFVRSCITSPRKTLQWLLLSLNQILNLCKCPPRSPSHPWVPIWPHLLLLCLSLSQSQPLWPPCCSSITPAWTLLRAFELVTPSAEGRGVGRNVGKEGRGMLFPQISMWLA